MLACRRFASLPVSPLKSVSSLITWTFRSQKSECVHFLLHSMWKTLPGEITRWLIFQIKHKQNFTCLSSFRQKASQNGHCNFTNSGASFKEGPSHARFTPFKQNSVAAKFHNNPTLYRHRKKSFCFMLPPSCISLYIEFLLSWSNKGKVI